jgi:ABC-type transporter Mla MlaB component
LAVELLLRGQGTGMIIIETREIADQTTFKVEGRLTGTGVATLEDCWRTASGRHPHRRFAVDLTEVTFIDQAGSLLLKWMDRDGVAFVTAGLMTDEVNEILGRKKK